MAFARWKRGRFSPRGLAKEAIATRKHDGKLPKGDGLVRARLAPRRLMATLVMMAIALLCALTTILGHDAARATTGDSDNLPPPKEALDVGIADSIAGRFYLTSVSRNAHIIGAQLDTAYTELAAPFLNGEIQLAMYNAQGQRTTVVFDWYPIEYSKGYVHGNLLSFATGSGVSEGRISFPYSLKDAGIGNKAKAIKGFAGVLDLKHHSYSVVFTRGNEAAPPPGDKIPTAKQTGK